MKYNALLRKTRNMANGSDNRREAELCRSHSTVAYVICVYNGAVNAV